jgi:hypothetical protein
MFFFFPQTSWKQKNKGRNDVVVLIDALLSPSVYLFCLSVDEMRQDGRDRRQQMVREFFFFFFFFKLFAT